MNALSSYPVKDPLILPKRVLVLGSGALKIGQAGEFDYSGTQALKALKEEGIYTVLVNPNIATIQTSHEFADNVYFVPLTPRFIEKVIAAEKVDAILLGFGGQTALNCGLALESSGVLRRFGVRVLGTPVSTIEATENRQLFVEMLDEIGVKTARSKAVSNPEEAVSAAKEIGFPVMLRAAFALGGKGSGVARNAEECCTLASRAFVGAPQVLVEEYLGGWKEIEYEVVRDSYDNCLAVCNMENVDPMGIHTGESIVVAPSQTLNDEEYQGLRDLSLKVIRHLGIIGECNIQFALNPRAWDYCVIEVNARLSRSSALASKATGYPLASIATKLALGYRLPELKNAITKTTTAFFEPALDYIVCKIPRWDLQKFAGVERTIGSEMKSVGEVMAIGRTFPEALQKALRMLDIGVDGLDPEAFSFPDVSAAIATPSPTRMFAIARGLAKGMRIEDIARLTAIDPFFIGEMARLVRIGEQLPAALGEMVSSEEAYHLREAKRAGYSDRAIAKKLSRTEAEVRELRRSCGIAPHLAQIDTLAAEYPAETNYLYLTYGAEQADVVASPRKKILVLGSGCYRIGSSVEFDWCAVNTVTEARALGYETLLLNCNPETVSTDYDICDRLIFDEITLESILEICACEHPEAIVISMGGQTPNTLALKLHQAGIKVLGTSPESIDRAESRDKFSALLDRLDIDQPRWAVAVAVTDVDEVVASIGGYPVLVRPSYVLSGAAMRVVSAVGKLREYIERATQLSSDHPVVLSKFETDALEVELDAVARQGEMILWAVSEHIEKAGVHSGDATLVFPAQRLSMEVLRQVRTVGEQLAHALQITGPFNVQMLVKHEAVKVIECNLRASRSFPFVSKVSGVNFIREATRAMLGVEPSRARRFSPGALAYVAVKAPQFSFDRLKGADPTLGVEMTSTGEVACFGATREEALLKAMLAAGFKLPAKGALLALDAAAGATTFVEEATMLRALGLAVFATPKTAASLRPLGHVQEVSEEDGSAQDLLRSGKVDVVFSDPGVASASADRASAALQRLAIDLGIAVVGEAALTREVIQALLSAPLEALEVKPWKQYLSEGSAARARRTHLWAHSEEDEAGERGIRLPSHVRATPAGYGLDRQLGATAALPNSTSLWKGYLGEMCTLLSHVEGDRQMIRARNQQLPLKNPVIVAQVLESPFVVDAYLGHTMPAGKDFLGEKDYIGLEELIAEMKQTPKKVILNIGDSSTSGWESNIVTQNRERRLRGLPLLPAFFQYKTYSDCLRDCVGDEYTVINAGVPAHTSLQGLRRLSLLLQRFKTEQLPIHWVTAYYGNNESVWDHNRQDKEWVGRKRLALFDWLSQRFRSTEASVITRVSAADYKMHLHEIVRVCQQQNIGIMLIEPLTPLYWKPGTRVLHEDLERNNYPGSTHVYTRLDEARDLWSQALQHEAYSNLKRTVLEEAREKDYIVPRIKRGHLAALHSVIQEMEVPSIHIDLDRSENDSRYFVDYCHPIHEPNQRIAGEIAAIVSGKSSGKEHCLREQHDSRVPTEASRCMLECPTEHYTLY